MFNSSQIEIHQSASFASLAGFPEPSFLVDWSMERWKKDNFVVLTTSKPVVVVERFHHMLRSRLPTLGHKQAIAAGAHISNSQIANTLPVCERI